MILLPMLYPEIFQKFNITPPKGVLFFGPPGTGKTLMARTLASTCTKAGEPIHFFMRKGADILSKWVGEAEKELRLLFEEARDKQPSIIFFDEIDGLAPARTNSSQSQHNSSIVATLLALMDGLDSRGNVIVIGATNRIDSLDPALRRPGRFDRELTFTLPSRSARNEILGIHTKAWEPPLDKDLLDWIGEKTVGYCGADIKSLCTEAALIALKRRFPQIYKSDEKLVIDTNRVKIQKEDFLKAMSKITPASHRSSVVHSRPMPYYLTPVLSDHLANCKKIFKKDFTGPLFRPWLIIHGEKDMGQNYIARALLYEMEEFPIYSIGMPSLISSNIGKEEALIVNFAEARKNVPSIIFIPDIDEWWEKSTELMSSSLITMMEDLPSTLQVFVLAYSNRPIEEIDVSLQGLFENLDYAVDAPSQESRRGMIKLLNDEISRKKETLLFKELPVLPKAIHTVKELTPQQKRNEVKVMFEVERELRCIMQTVLAEHKRFDVFFTAKEVDGATLFTVYDIDAKLNKYYHPDQFAQDFKFFADNAAMYADSIDPLDGPLENRITSKGKYLYQSVVHLIDKDFPKDLTKKCDEIRMRRRVVKESITRKKEEDAKVGVVPPVEQPTQITLHTLK
jgi:SpoVK/Ycf46/Vps4 family AAA+-type ATPase